MLPGNAEEMIVAVEVDSLEQLGQVLPQDPDIVLLDNMSIDQLRQAVVARDAARSGAELEASGGVNLETVTAIAQTGVDRISVGALTHAATSLDVALDWET
jgi:nicotinate-nucleotide pyrophosphorylase (carboxylating)